MKFCHKKSCLSDLLQNGGDERIKVNTFTGMNRYGSGLFPRKDEINFSSTTATTISSSTSSYAINLFQDIKNAPDICESTVNLYNKCVEKIKSILSIEGNYVALTASGTDALMLAVDDFSNKSPEEITCLLCGSDETASSAANAASLKYFSEIDIFGLKIGKGKPSANSKKITKLIEIPLKDAEGKYFEKSNLESKIEKVIKSELDKKQRVILIVIDQSKLGNIFPDMSFLHNLRDNYLDKLDILVDACQMRLSSLRIRQYLNFGCTVLITGSKFLTGPAFSGAIIKPKDKALCLTPELSKYLLTHESITALHVKHLDGYIAILLRWAVSIKLWNDLVVSVSEKKQSEIMLSLSKKFSAELNNYEYIRPLFIDEFDVLSNGRDDIFSCRTIFPFMVLDKKGDITSEKKLRTIYSLLNADVSSLFNSEYKKIAAFRCHIGQPVAITDKCGVLRVSIGLRMLIGAAKNDVDRFINDQFKKLQIVIKKIELLKDLEL